MGGKGEGERGTGEGERGVEILSAAGEVSSSESTLLVCA